MDFFQTVESVRVPPHVLPEILTENRPECFFRDIFTNYSRNSFWNFNKFFSRNSSRDYFRGTFFWRNFFKNNFCTVISSWKFPQKCILKFFLLFVSVFLSILLETALEIEKANPLEILSILALVTSSKIERIHSAFFWKYLPNFHWKLIQHFLWDSLRCLFMETNLFCHSFGQIYFYLYLRKFIWQLLWNFIRWLLWKFHRQNFRSILWEFHPSISCIIDYSYGFFFRKFLSNWSNRLFRASFCV